MSAAVSSRFGTLVDVSSGIDILVIVGVSSAGCFLKNMNG